jgi:hypothetical protein
VHTPPHAKETCALQHVHQCSAAHKCKRHERNTTERSSVDDRHRVEHTSTLDGGVGNVVAAVGDCRQRIVGIQDCACVVGTIAGRQTRHRHFGVVDFKLFKGAAERLLASGWLRSGWQWRGDGNRSGIDTIGVAWEELNSNREVRRWPKILRAVCSRCQDLIVRYQQWRGTVENDIGTTEHTNETSELVRERERDCVSEQSLDASK